jgi:hypothetical protein
MQPLFIHGTFGIGKTDTVEQWAKQYAKNKGLKYSSSIEDINKEDYFINLIIPMTLYDNVNLAGIPVKSADGKSTEFLPTNMLPRKGQGNIFFDELNLAPPLTQSTVYGVIQKGVIGNVVLPKGYMRIGAGNTESDMAHVFSMANPLKNRFRHVELGVPSVDRWIKDFAIHNNIDNRIIAFLSFKNDYLFKYNSEMTDEQTAIATPRTWEMMSKDIKGIENKDDMLETFVGMSVGNGIAREFMTHINLIESYNISDIMAGKDFKVPIEIDKIYALVSGIVSYYLKHYKEKDYSKVFYDVSAKLSAEYSTMAMYIVSRTDTQFFLTLEKAIGRKEMGVVTKRILEISN